MYRSALRIGDHGEQVTRLNTILKSLGYGISNSIDSFDQRTYSAVISFQNDHNINITGMADEKTLRALEKKIPEKLTEDDIYIKEPEPKITYETHEVESESLATDEIDVVESESMAAGDIDVVESESIPSDETHEVELESMTAGEIGALELETAATDGMHEAESEFMTMEEIYAFESELMTIDEIYANDSETETANKEIETEAVSAEQLSANEAASQQIFEIFTNELTSADELFVSETELNPAYEIYINETESIFKDDINANQTESMSKNEASESEAKFEAAYAYKTRPNLKKGSTGHYVTELQDGLKQLGYSIRVDGDFGRYTEYAVISFQASNNLLADGIVGAKTWDVFDDVMDSLSNHPAVSNPTLKEGSNNIYVKQLQNKLGILGYYNGPIDGIMGYNTDKAVRAFQTANNLKSDGYVGPLTWLSIENALTSTPTDYPQTTNRFVLKNGSRGEAVVQLQNKLNELGYYNYIADGYFGNYTETAVRNLQKNYGLIVDGIYGPKTAKVLDHELMITHPGIRELKEGSTGDDVMILQDRLKYLGYFTNNTTGHFDQDTAISVKNFQSYNKMNPDGIVDKDIWDSIFEKEHRPPFADNNYTDRTKPALRYGNTGEHVAYLQKLLTHLMFYCGRITGEFDWETLLSVKCFQDANSIMPDGIVDRITWSALESLYPHELFYDKVK